MTDTKSRAATQRAYLLVLAGTSAILLCNMKSMKCTRINTGTHKCTQSMTDKDTGTHKRRCTGHIHIYTDTYTYSDTCTDTDRQTHTRTHAHTQTHTQTHTHTHRFCPCCALAPK